MNKEYNFLMKIFKLTLQLSKNINILFAILFLSIFTFLYFPYLSGHEIYMFLFPNNDYLVAIWPYKKYISDIIYSHQILKNGFLYGSGLGNNIFALKSVILDPFNWLFLNNSSNTYIIWQFLCKLFAIYILIYNILVLRTKNKLLSNLFSLFFTFNGMFVFWSTQDMHFTAMVFIILQWFGYELYRNSGKIGYFICLSIPLFMLSTIYWAIVFNIFFVIFIILDSIWEIELITNQKKSRFFLKIIIAYVFIVLICAWSILPEFWVLVHNGRVNIGAHQSGFLHIKLITQFGAFTPLQLYDLRLYAQFILRGFGNYVIPMDKIWVSTFSGPLWYSSIFVLVSACAFIFSYSTRSKKILFNLIISLVLLFLFFPFVILVFNGMSDLRMRWSWFLLIPLLLCAIKYWMQTPNINKFRFSLIFLAIVFTSTAFYAYYKGELYFTDRLVLFTYIELYLCFILLFCLSFLKKYAFLGLFLVGVIDLIFQNYMFINNAMPINANYVMEKQYYYDNTIDAVTYIKQKDHSPFYRVDKTYASMPLCDYCGLNENMVQGYFGVKTYISTPNPAYFAFSHDMDAKPYYNFIFGFDKRYDLLNMLGVKYILSKELQDMSGYRLQEKFKDVYIYTENNYKGIGKIFHNYISRKDFMYQPLIKDSIFSRCLVIPGFLLGSHVFDATSIQNCVNLPRVLDNEVEHFSLDKLSGNEIVGTANLVKPGILFLAIPFDYGFRAKIDGKYQPVLNVADGFIGVYLSSGVHSIEIKYLPPMLKIGLIISSLALLIMVSLITFGRIKKE